MKTLVRLGVGVGVAMLAVLFVASVFGWWLLPLSLFGVLAIAWWSGGTLLPYWREKEEDVGVPVEWADEPGLWEMLKRESSSTKDDLNCTARNPLPSGGDPEGSSTLGDGSHVFGAFQMEAQNFDNPAYDYEGGYDEAVANPDCFRQARTGLLYIEDRHGSPAQAWEDYQANGYY